MNNNSNTSNNNNRLQLLSLLLLISLQHNTVTAWGPLAHHTNRLGVTELKMTDDEHSSSYRAQLERTYSASEAFLDDDGFFDMSIFEDTDFVRNKVIDAIASEHDDDWTAEAMAACGDDCEECLIPDDLKIIPDDSVNVMAFLGIQRAQPLQKRTDWD